ncbi:hypothetical protein DL98DRAFT_548007 [Cadophora sp. DSE1049]|nr:hypothetical protein DL98DRAFT_548007 [Cadophora sp. DSE1049]
MSQDPSKLMAYAEKAAKCADTRFSLLGGRTKCICHPLIFAPTKRRSLPQRQATIQDLQLNSPDEAANTLVEAFNVYGKENPIAECYELELEDRKYALDTYEITGGWFEIDGVGRVIDGHDRFANRLYRKPNVIEIFEKLAFSSVAKMTRNYQYVLSAKEYSLKAGLVHLATMDLVAFGKALESYKDVDPVFEGTRAKHQLLIDLQLAAVRRDVELFTKVVELSKNFGQLDPWKEVVLGIIKAKLEVDDDDFS